jgi:mannose-6-phosphate isomerase-like protein (cupin superfamily)
MTCILHNVHLGTRRIHFRKETFPKIFVDKTTHFRFNNFFSENLVFYEILWKIYGRTRHGTHDNVIWFMRFDWWLDKARDLQ